MGGRVTDVQVRTESLRKLFGAVQAVDGIDLEVGRGDLLTILGPSGCGKTTLLRLIAGFEQPTDGRVFIGGRDVTFVPPHRRPANMVFQRYALFPHLTVAENVGFGLRVRGLPAGEVADRVQNMLGLVELPDFGDRRVTQLSGGQAQRVALARALINEPEVLLLDEPLGALDLKIRQQMQIELKLLHARLGMTFIYVTHDQEEAMSISDRIVVMNEGRVAQDGRPEDIYNHPASTFVADFIGHSNILRARVTRADLPRVEFLRHEFAVRTHPDLSIGQEVSVVIRPEALVISSNAQPDLQNNIAGQVVDATFKGAFVHYLVQVGGFQFKAQQPVHEGVFAFERGAQVVLSWAGEDAQVLVA